MNNKKLDIIVIGAGPAGLTSALLLARSGHQITIIDKNREIKRKVCGEYLCPTGVEILKKLDLYGPIKNTFNALYGMKIVSPNSTVLTTFFPHKGNLSDRHYGLSLNRKIFDSYLLEQAKNFPNIEIHQNSPLESLEKRDKKWQLKAGNLNHCYDLVIAADGIYSQTAKLLGHSKPNKGNKIALHCFLPLKDIRYHTRIGQMHIFEDGSYCGLDPICQDEINFSIVCDKKRLNKKRPYQLINEYIEKSSFLSRMFDPLNEKKKVLSLFPITKSNPFIAGDGVAYVGDAAGFIDPLTGEGIYNALLSAQLLSSQINAYPIKTALKKYKKEKKKIFFQKNLLNKGFQFIIRYPFLSNLIARYLKKDQQKANTFIAILGNIYTPLQGIKKILFQF